MRNLLYLALFLLLFSCSGNRDRYYQISGFAQGGRYSVKYNAKGSDVSAEAVKDSVESLLLQIDTTLSGYNPASQLSRFNAGQAIRPNPMFLEMYQLGYALWERSKGALDFAAGPLYDAWGFGFKNSSFPSEKQVDSLLTVCGMKLLPRELPLKDGILDPADLGFPRLNYNAVAQGYSSDVIARYLYSIGIKDMLVDIGEIWCDGLNPSRKPWAVGIDKPVDHEEGDEQQDIIESVWMSEGKPCGIVTSGNYRKFYVRDGRKYAHTIDPVSGHPVSHNLLSASIVSSNSSAEADALATWCMVLGLEASIKIIEEDPALEGFLIYQNAAGEMAHWASEGFTLRPANP